jgi:hypothetical protein
MLFAWICRKEYLKRLALIFCFAVGYPAFAGARQLPKAQAPVGRTIILPPNIVAGAPATLAVLDSAGRLAPNAVVELSGGRKVTTDVTGRALFVAPAEPGKLIAKITGRQATASSTVTAVADSATRSSVEGLRVISYPHSLAIHDRFTLEGTGFQGAAESNHVFLADQPCLVLASSPVSLVALPGPHVVVGAMNLRVSVAGQNTLEIPVSAVSLQFSGPTEAPETGTEGKIILSVHGTTEPLAVEVRNGSPGIIQFPRGNLQRLVTSGGEQNVAPVELKFLASGDYTVTARLMPTASARPPNN